MSKATGLAVAGLGLLLSACQVVGPDYHLPEEAAIHRDDLQGELAVAGKPVVSAPVPADWWRLYRDPRLDQLVQQAMASNTDLRVAAASLLRARAQSTRPRRPVAGAAA
jgi:outer membrane protein TolC